MPRGKAPLIRMYPVRLLSEYVDKPTNDIIYRFQVDDKIKYLSAAPGTYAPNTTPSLPPQDYGRNNAAIAYIGKHGDLKHKFENWRGVREERLWHRVIIRCLELEEPERLRLAISAYMDPATPYYAKIKLFQIIDLENETMVYEILRDTSIAPKFRGHIDENGRVVGFILEKVESRMPADRDFEACKAVLQRFHNLGWVHNNLKKEHFLIRPDGSARLISFGQSRARESNLDVLDEMKELYRIFGRL
ncbi:hypothetical protein BO78DRAFT_386882 [Aspergillus sclerotiicarbonarius CBS 121057]|uniref:Protein kinase domain-containing protein n=1 Tax=Aspergillus sclerotiicarbonarius (strain CBS 121057 / IBT 28362) TaxID=1448318 RepID=A0A319EFN0_ASPSB|nr:hypothetical protein BO78DRAFT_386882 [Aspergillus sclerotiicarbonarius CBS 121057]